MIFPFIILTFSPFIQGIILLFLVIILYTNGSIGAKNDTVY
jgi:hypothetical protein